MRDYRKLDVWAKAHELYLYVKTQLAPKLPRKERFELTSQLLRASLSVPLNIVEGCGRFTDKDFAHFLDTSLGSINETAYCCQICFEIKFISGEDYKNALKLINETRAMLINFLKFLWSSNNNPKP